MVTTNDRGEQDRYGHWFPPFEPAAAPQRPAAPAPEPAAPEAPTRAPGPEGGAEAVFTPDHKAPTAAEASRDAPTPTWLSAGQEADTTTSPRKPRKTRTPKPPKKPEATRSPESSTPPPPPPASGGTGAGATPDPAPGPRPDPGPPAQKKSKRPLLIGGLCAAAALVVGAFVIAVATSPGVLSRDDSANADAQPAPDSSGFCVESEQSGTIVSNGPGDQSSGPNAILAFEHAYYVTRDAEKVRAVVTSDVTNLKSADELQPILDSTPTGTEHCATIVQTAPNRFFLTLRLNPAPEGGPYTMNISTTEIGDKTFITRMESTS